jgi:hypothetical protein
MYDSGSEVTIVSNKAARLLRAGKFGKSNIEITGVGGGVTHPDWVFSIDFPGIDGDRLNVLAHGINGLGIHVEQQDLQILSEHFPETDVGKFSNPGGEIDLLIGMDNHQLWPKEVSRGKRLLLWESRIKNDSPLIVAGSVASSGPWAFSGHARVTHFNPQDFISAEALGTDIPRRCKACGKCNECTFRTTALTALENAEYEVIVNNLVYDANAKKWSTAYPFIESPTVLKNNYSQALACLRSLETQLRKKGRLDEFNIAFQDIVDRGVFRELTPHEVSSYSGPVNYISTVAAYKTGPHSTTPLRICMNSSMKQSAPVSKSLNDILMKGPPALADLFVVTLGFREGRFALIKDLSKFYNCVSTDSTAQHMRRVLWRGGDPEAVPKIYITTTVNFGDKPAGCIAIAAVRETAERFGGESPAAWFLKNRTYVDDCTATSDSMADLENISQDLERIVSFGGFKFKETNMSGDPLSEEGAIKVLGLIWDTENDTLKVDCRVNFAGKRGGAKLGPDMDLRHGGRRI